MPRSSRLTRAERAVLAVFYRSERGGALTTAEVIAQHAASPDRSRFGASLVARMASTSWARERGATSPALECQPHADGTPRFRLREMWTATHRVPVSP